MSTYSVTMIYVYYEHDGRLGTDIKTFVKAHRLPLGYQANRLLKMASDIYDENRRVGRINLTNLCIRIQSV